MSLCTSLVSVGFIKRREGAAREMDDNDERSDSTRYVSSIRPVATVLRLFHSSTRAVSIADNEMDKTAVAHFFLSLNCRCGISSF